MTLPQMPEPGRVVHADSLRPDHFDRLFTADQLRAYGAACYAAGMDRAAEVCDARARHHDRMGDARLSVEADHCADAIRAAMASAPPAAKPGE